MRVLLIEDEPEMASVLKTALERLDIIVDHAATLADGEAVARLGYHDAVVLDRRLPDGDGLGLIPRLRALHLDVPVIALTAMSGLDDRVAGLDAGADDYMVKPFATVELVARLHALHRRSFTSRANQTMVGRLIYDFRHREAGRTIMRGALEEAVYALDDEIGSNALDAHISRLRRKLDDVAAGIEIRAIRNLGYLLRAAS
ncbi:response regulator transcription factor [Mesorhizobium sp. B4-1-4]|uniref:response regulator transcription factor n=1 Tax=Mesorhizobium sp. B4-1-4 TaxID=2589888 RepID=UPI0011282759|nr:response regulator transcription factor [Mesorhizobium sp. B4-1-4]UCI31649.1 response regulator transcription factor [Mesorhizobium sp. B4-1-4]